MLTYRCVDPMIADGFSEAIRRPSRSTVRASKHVTAAPQLGNDAHPLRHIESGTPEIDQVAALAKLGRLFDQRDLVPRRMSQNASVGPAIPAPTIKTFMTHPLRRPLDR